MGFTYSYELIAPAARTGRLVAALLPHLCREDRVRLRAALPWRPRRSTTHQWCNDEQVQVRHGIAGLCGESDLDDSYCFSMLFRRDEAIDEYEDRRSFDRSRGLPTEVGRVRVGCVWVSLRAGRSLCVLEASAATSCMSVLFQDSENVRQTFRRIARAARALALFFDAEERDLVLCARQERGVTQPDHEPYELERFGDLHVDAYYGALLAAARIRPLPVAA
jgi:hypothetical protein